MQKTAMLLPYEFEPIFKSLPLEQAGLLILALYQYEHEEVEPDFSDNEILQFSWKTHIKPKVDEYKEKYKKTCEARREAGSKGGKSNQEKQKQAKQANATFDNQNEQKVANQADIDRDIDGDIDIDKDKDIKNTCAFDNGFELFWNEYPKHKGKPVAEKAFIKAIKKIDIDTMLEAIRKQKQSAQWKKENGQYIPYPATWLNQERWADEDDKEKDDGVLEALGDLIDDD